MTLIPGSGEQNKTIGLMQIIIIVIIEIVHEAHIHKEICRFAYVRRVMSASMLAVSTANKPAIARVIKQNEEIDSVCVGSARLVGGEASGTQNLTFYRIATYHEDRHAVA